MSKKTYIALAVLVILIAIIFGALAAFKQNNQQHAGDEVLSEEAEADRVYTTSRGDAFADLQREIELEQQGQ